MEKNYKKNLAQVNVGDNCKMVSVKDNSSSFLQYVDKVGLAINRQIQVVSKQEYDALMVIEVNGITSAVSQKFAENIYVD
jgi:DtxR family Mn-dependent transcriptional regulator